MSAERVIIAVIVIAAVSYMLRLTWKRYTKNKKSSCCGDKPKHVSLTMKGKTMRR